MPTLDEQINQKLDEQLQRVKNDLITFNSIQNIIEKTEALEKEVEELKNKKKCSNNGKCMPCNLCSFSLF